VRQASCCVMDDLWQTVLRTKEFKRQEILLNLARDAINDPYAAVRKQAFSTLAELAKTEASVEKRFLLFKSFLALLSAKQVLALFLSMWGSCAQDKQPTPRADHFWLE
jgi:hypothetical protein